MANPPFPRPLLLGHRGARAFRILGLPFSTARVPPANTLPAFRYALDHGCDGFEIDVRYTLDRHRVLWHDEWAWGKDVASTKYSDLDRRLMPIPCLEDVLVEFGHNAYLDIELKVSGNEEQVLSELHAHPPRRFVVSSFLPDVLTRLHSLNCEVPLGYICKKEQGVACWTKLPIKIFLPHYPLASERLIEKVHEHGVQVIAWTVNDSNTMLRLAGWGVDGIISDDPALLGRTFAAEKSFRTGHSSG